MYASCDILIIAHTNRLKYDLERRIRFQKKNRFKCALNRLIGRTLRNTCTYAISIESRINRTKGEIGGPISTHSTIYYANKTLNWAFSPWNRN